VSNLPKRLVLGIARFVIRLAKGLLRVSAFAAGIALLMLVLDTLLLGNARRPD
jgi:hypothetical protein